MPSTLPRNQENDRAGMRNSRLLVVAAVLLLAMGLGFGVWIWAYQNDNTATEVSPEKQQSVSPTRVEIATAPEIQKAQNLTAKLEALVDQVTSAYGGSAGVALAVPGEGASMSQAGTLTQDVAWSTAKVPIAMALVQRTGIVDSTVRKAITISDNASAEAMWAALGDPESAAEATNQILRRGGDFETAMNTDVVRPGFSAFGQTTWSLEDQAGFGAAMQCVPGGEEIAQLMRSISPGQAYGLGRIPGAAFKGGWGPDPQNNYLVRQFGVIPVGAQGDYVGVAIAAKSGDGTYDSGKAMLNDVADALRTLSLPGGTCLEENVPGKKNEAHDVTSLRRVAP